MSSLAVLRVRGNAVTSVNLRLAEMAGRPTQRAREGQKRAEGPRYQRNRRRKRQGYFRQRLLIDNESEKGVVCQNGTVMAYWRAPSIAPQSPLSPSVPPPYPTRYPKCAILAQFGMSKALESRSGAGWEQAGLAWYCSQRFDLTGWRVGTAAAGSITAGGGDPLSRA